MEEDKKTLVVGGSGLIGRSLCKTLKKSKVDAINLSNDGENVASYKNVYGDVTDKECVESIFDRHSINNVVNLAAPLVSESTKDPIAAIRIGVEGNTNLLEMCEKYQVKRFIYASSTSLVRPGLDNNKAVTEDAQVFTESIYEEVKSFVEEIGARVSSTYGFEFISARISLVVGPGQPSRTSAYRTDMFNLLSSGGEIHFPFRGEEVIPISHCEDVSRSLYLLLASPNLEHGIYNIPCEAWKVSDLADRITRFGEGIRVTFGDQMFSNGAPYIDWTRIRNELGADIVPLEERLVELKGEQNEHKI